MEGHLIPRVEEELDCGRRQGRNGGYGGSARRQDDVLGRWWETVPPLGLLFCLALGGDNGAERFCGVQLGRHVRQDARKTHVVLWTGLSSMGRFMSVQQRNQSRVLVRAKGDWSRDNLWILDCNGLEKGQYIIAIVCDGGQCLGGSLLCLTCFRRPLSLFLHAYFAFFVVAVVFPFGGFPFLHPLLDGAIENLQELACVRLPVDNCGIRDECWEEDGVARRSVLLLL